MPEIACRRCRRNLPPDCPCRLAGWPAGRRVPAGVSGGGGGCMPDLPLCRHARVLRSGRTVVCRRTRPAGEAKPVAWCLHCCAQLEAVLEAGEDCRKGAGKRRETQQDRIRK